MFDLFNLDNPTDALEGYLIYKDVFEDDHDKDEDGTDQDGDDSEDEEE